MQIRRLENPVDAIADLTALRVAWAAEQGRVLEPDDLFPTEFASWVERESSHREFWLASIDSAPVGMVNLLIFDRMPTVGIPSGGWGYLCNMYVRAEHRNGGLGAELAAAVLSYADACRLERVVLSPSERSRPFYASLGFGPASNLLLRPRPR